MTYAQNLKKGTSLCFTGSLSAESLAELKACGIDAVEFSFNKARYYDEFDFVNRAQDYADRVRVAGLEWWSLHLPFSGKLDISILDDALRAEIMKINTEMILAAGKAGCKVAVLHPSSEPISDDIRPQRLAYSRENIIRLREVCDSVGMKLAVENLPRTCLCNRSQEMIDLLRGTGAGVVFDTNHSLVEENVEFLTALTDAGLEIITLHISDYDFVDERHRLPGDGINHWTGILAALEKVGYKGPLMYEVPKQPKEREPITTAQLAENMEKLAAGEIA
ncbi:MAG: sugar phosphate isomerase/epimerase [Clostridia bacterium]|nr:sugar phosphate isomerase/epimerase [Clostridia bacterium]